MKAPSCFGRSCLNAAAGAVVALAGGAAVGLFTFRAALSRDLEGKRVFLTEIARIKYSSIVDWLGERELDRLSFARDADLLSAYRRAGDPAVRRDLEARFKRLRERQGMRAAFVFVGGRLAFASPPGAPFDLGRLEVEIEKDFPGGRLVYKYPTDHKIFRTLLFWPSRDRGFSSEVRPPGPEPAGPFVVTLRLPGSGWLFVCRFDPQVARADAVREGWRAGLASAAVIAALMFLLVAEHRRRLLARLREADARTALLAQAVEQSAEAVVITDADAVIEYVNPAFTRITGYAPAEVLGRKPNVLKSGKHAKEFYGELWASLARGETWQGRLINRRKDGRFYEEEASIGPVRGEDGKVTHYVAVKRDASGERQLEDQLRHAQKMEAVGRIAGGVAHDFNNILTSIIGYAELADGTLPKDAPERADLAEVLKAARLAAALTSRLLTFSRRQIAEPTTIDVSEPARALEKMLRRTLGENVRLELDLAPEPLWVKIDPAQEEQILLNLAINARDAMPSGGRLRITTASVELERAMRHGLITIPEGRWARLSVIDDGTGMDRDILEKIFEPFFTTKEKGRGTGLGLATVFGIVSQNEGHIAVDSAKGWGSVFTIYLPLVPAPAEIPGGARPDAPAGPAGTVLLVEDQDEVRNVAERVLRSGGWSVLPCKDGREALAVEAAHRGRIDLLLTDVIMPGMGGAELAERFKRSRPETPVLFMSGYTDETVAHSGSLRQGVDLLPKPFSPSSLLERVAAAAARGAGPDA